MNKSVLVILFAITASVAGFAGYSWLQKNSVSRTNPVDSTNQPYSFETAERTDRVDSPIEPYSFVKTTITQTSSDAVPKGELVIASLESEAAVSTWEDSISKLNAATDQLSAVEQLFSSNNKILPEAASISGKFSDFNRELDALVSSSHLLQDAQARPDPRYFQSIGKPDDFPNSSIARCT